MNTIVYSAVGIIALVGISFLFHFIGDVRNTRAAKRLAELRKRLAPKKRTQPGGEVTPAFRRNTPFNIFPPNGDTPVL